MSAGANRERTRLREDSTALKEVCTKAYAEKSAALVNNAVQHFNHPNFCWHMQPAGEIWSGILADAEGSHAMPLTADEIKQILKLQPHPTCGFVLDSYRSSLQIPADALPAQYGSPRPYGSVLYFLVAREAEMRLHRIRSDQMYHHYLGDPLEVLLLYADGRSEVRTVGSDLAAGMQPQLIIPGGTFHVSRLRAGGEYALLGTSEWPGVEPPDVELGDPEALISAFPAMREKIEAFTAVASSGH